MQTGLIPRGSRSCERSRISAIHWDEGKVQEKGTVAMELHADIKAAITCTTAGEALYLLMRERVVGLMDDAGTKPECLKQATFYRGQHWRSLREAQTDAATLLSALRKQV
jgi:hypothetical protein